LVAVAAVAAAGLIGSACSSSGDPASAQTAPPATTAPPTTVATSTPPTTGGYDTTPGTDPDHAAIAGDLARARTATARFATDLDAAKAAGYRIITPMMTNMGFHFLNPDVKDFDIEKPDILVYEHPGDAWQLAALEWVFPEQPATPPLEGATYGSFPAACHYDDGTFVPADAQASCAATSPDTGSPFVFWHPPLVTMHVWIWYPNPDGLFASMNPLIAPFNAPDPPTHIGHAV
jgi:hypothetical protein